MWCWKGLDQRADPVKKGRFALGFTEILYFGWLTHIACFSNHLVSYLPQNGPIDSLVSDTTAGQKIPQALFSSLTIDHVDFLPLTIDQITLYASFEWLWAFDHWPTVITAVTIEWPHSARLCSILIGWIGQFHLTFQKVHTIWQPFCCPSWMQ